MRVSFPITVTLLRLSQDWNLEMYCQALASCCTDPEGLHYKNLRGPINQATTKILSAAKRQFEWSTQLTVDFESAILDLFRPALTLA